MKFTLINTDIAKSINLIHVYWFGTVHLFELHQSSNYWTSTVYIFYVLIKFNQ